MKYYTNGFMYWVKCTNGCEPCWQAYITDPNKTEVFCSNCKKQIQVDNQKVLEAWCDWISFRVEDLIKHLHAKQEELEQDYKESYHIIARSGGHRLLSKTNGNLHYQIQFAATN